MDIEEEISKTMVFVATNSTLTPDEKAALLNTIALFRAHAARQHDEQLKLHEKLQAQLREKCSHAQICGLHQTVLSQRFSELYTLLRKALSNMTPELKEAIKIAVDQGAVELVPRKEDYKIWLDIPIPEESSKQ